MKLEILSLIIIIILSLDIDDMIEDDKKSESGYTVNFENNQFTLSSEHFSHIQNKIQTVTKQVIIINIVFPY